MKTIKRKNAILIVDGTRKGTYMSDTFIFHQRKKMEHQTIGACDYNTDIPHLSTRARTYGIFDLKIIELCLTNQTYENDEND